MKFIRYITIIGNGVFVLWLLANGIDEGFRATLGGIGVLHLPGCFIGSKYLVNFEKKMKITICGSAAFIKEMEAVAGQLKKLGHKVKSMPVKFVDGDGKVWQYRWIITNLKNPCRLTSRNF